MTVRENLEFHYDDILKNLDSLKTLPLVVEALESVDWRMP
jgi:hypothetical protein